MITRRGWDVVSDLIGADKTRLTVTMLFHHSPFLAYSSLSARLRCSCWLVVGVQGLPLALVRQKEFILVSSLHELTRVLANNDGLLQLLTT